MATPTKRTGLVPGRLDFNDDKYQLRQINSMGSILHDMGTNRDPSLPFKDLVEASSNIRKIIEFLDKQKIEDPDQTDPAGYHFRKNCRKEIRPFMRQAFYFFKTCFPDETDRSGLRFATVAFLEGPDRALKAFEDQDTLWRGFDVPAVFMAPFLLYQAEKEEQDRYLEHLRHLYYGRITHREDPRDSGHYGPVTMVVPSNSLSVPSNVNARYAFPKVFGGPGQSQATAATPLRISKTQPPATGGDDDDDDDDGNNDDDDDDDQDQGQEDYDQAFRQGFGSDPPLNPVDWGQSFSQHQLPTTTVFTFGAGAGATSGATSGAVPFGSSVPPPPPISQQQQHQMPVSSSQAQISQAQQYQQQQQQHQPSVKPKVSHPGGILRSSARLAQGQQGQQGQQQGQQNPQQNPHDLLGGLPMSSMIQVPPLQPQHAATIMTTASSGAIPSTSVGVSFPQQGGAFGPLAQADIQRAQTPLPFPLPTSMGQIPQISQQLQQQDLLTGFHQPVQSSHAQAPQQAQQAQQLPQQHQQHPQYQPPFQPPQQPPQQPAQWGVQQPLVQIPDLQPLPLPGQQQQQQYQQQQQQHYQPLLQQVPQPQYHRQQPLPQQAGSQDTQYAQLQWPVNPQQPQHPPQLQQPPQPPAPSPSQMSPTSRHFMSTLTNLARNMEISNQTNAQLLAAINRPGSRVSGMVTPPSSPSQQQQQQQRRVGFREDSPVGFRSYSSMGGRESVVRPVPILPEAGRVLDPSQPFPHRRRVPIPNRTDPVVQYAQDMNMDPTMAGIALGFSQAHRKASREARALDFEIETINPLSNETNVDSFDYNIQGRTE